LLFVNSSDWDKFAEDYYSEVLSPIKNSINNPLLDALKKLDSKNLKVLEVGCGLGELVPFLSKNFKEVVAIDFSDKMIQLAKEMHKQTNVSFRVMDMTKLDFSEEFDVIISVNSLLMPSIKDLNKSISALYSCLKKGGKLFAIVPSIESHIYQSMLVLDKKLDEGASPSKAIIRAKKSMQPERYDFVQGVIEFDGDLQKAFYRFEILYRFERAGFKKFIVDKVYYSWKEWQEAGYDYFPEEKEPWDWYFTCEK